MSQSQEEDRIREGRPPASPPDIRLNRQQAPDPRRFRLVPAGAVYPGREGWLAIYFTWWTQREAWFKTKEEAVAFLDAKEDRKFVVRSVVWLVGIIVALILIVKGYNYMEQQSQNIEKKKRDFDNVWETTRR